MHANAPTAPRLTVHPPESVRVRVRVRVRVAVGQAGIRRDRGHASTVYGPRLTSHVDVHANAPTAPRLTVHPPESVRVRVRVRVRVAVGQAGIRRDRGHASHGLRSTAHEPRGRARERPHGSTAYGPPTRIRASAGARAGAGGRRPGGDPVRSGTRLHGLRSTAHEPRGRARERPHGSTAYGPPTRIRASAGARAGAGGRRPGGDPARSGTRLHGLRSTAHEPRGRARERPHGSAAHGSAPPSPRMPAGSRRSQHKTHAATIPPGLRQRRWERRHPCRHLLFLAPLPCAAPADRAGPRGFFRARARAGGRAGSRGRAWAGELCRAGSIPIAIAIAIPIATPRCRCRCRYREAPLSWRSHVTSGTPGLPGVRCPCPHATVGRR